MENIDTREFNDNYVTETPSPISFVINWTIPNFSFFKEHTEMIKSSDHATGNSLWHLELTPLVEPPSNDAEVNTVGLEVWHRRPPSQLKTHTDHTCNIHARIKLGLADANQQFLKDHTETVEVTYVEGHGMAYGSHKLITHDKLFDPKATILVGDKLVLRVEVTYASLDELSSSDQGYKMMDEPCSPEEFRQNFRSLYDSKIGCDFVLVSSDGAERPVHRAVLIARSPVFAAMFDSNFSEAQTGRCVIQDVGTNVLEMLIKFMYCDCLAGIVEVGLEEILIAADKYQLTSLMRYCEFQLVMTMYSCNVVDVLLLADKLKSTKTLKDNAMFYIWANRESSKSSGVFRELYERASPELLTEVFAYHRPTFK